MLEIEMQFSALNTRTKSLTVDQPLGQYFGRFGRTITILIRRSGKTSRSIAKH